MRLLAGAAEPEGALWAGIEITLEPGWKTYWRSPGPSGIPPRLDWSASENVAGIEMLWPAPARFGEAQGGTIGYAEQVVFPLRVVPADPARPVRLSVALDYGVCESLCVPVAHTAETVLDGEGPDAVSISRWLARVPDETAFPAPPGGPGAVAAEIAHSDGQTRLLVTAHEASADYFLEEGQGRLAPLAATRPDGRIEFALSDDFVETPRRLTLTTVSGSRAVVQSWRPALRAAK